MSKENADQRAFPVTNGGVVHPGLTKREFIAALAMQGLLANSVVVLPTGINDDKSFEQFSKASVKYADELLKQLE